MVTLEYGRYQQAIPTRLVAEPSVSLKVAFGRAVGRLRTALGYSQEQLGARAGLAPVHVGAIERGESNVSLAAAERLAGALGVRISDLLLQAERERVR